MDMTCNDVALLIDHSLLAPAMTDAQIRQGAELARECRVAGVCVKPYAVKTVAEILRGSGVKPGVTIGFPHGGHATSVKAFEAEQALADGAEELDMVVNVGKVLSGEWEYVRRDIAAVVGLAHEARAIVKVIFENCCLRDEHKVRLCELCTELNVDFVKTSTGFGEAGATVEDVRLMRERCPSHIGVKAAGGIRTLDKLLALRQAGAGRIGTSATAAILEECRRLMKRS